MSHLVLDRVKDEITFFPLFKKGALFLQVTGIGLVFVAGITGPIDKVFIAYCMVCEGLG